MSLRTGEIKPDGYSHPANIGLDAWCYECKGRVTMRIQPMRADSGGGEVAYGDVVCNECHGIMMTLLSERIGQVVVAIDSDATTGGRV